MHISEAGMPAPEPGAEPCRFPKLEECAHFHYERVQLPHLEVSLQDNLDKSQHSQHTNDEKDLEYFMIQVTSAEECWLVQRNFQNFKMLDAQIHQCIFDRKISQLVDISSQDENQDNIIDVLKNYLKRFSVIADNSVNCGPVLNWFQMDNKGHRLLVPSEESRSINTPAVAAAYSVRRYVSQARDELNLEVGDMISVIDMTSPAESIWWRGKRGFQVGFFPQHCVHIIGDKVPRNMPIPPPVVGTLALSPVKPVLRKHGKLIAFFRSFILNRPSRRRLKQSGILKERVFGCDLGEHLLNSGHDIPMVLKCCAEFIEKHGIVDGIYRLSGITSNIQKLRNTFDEDRIPDLYTEDILQDIHSVASLLKMYFRELPNPLCTYQLYQGFVNAVQGCHSINRNSANDRERLLKMREVVQKLPPPHYRTLEYLMRHLARVAKHGPSTGMTTRNIAIVWAPNLLRCAELEIGGVAALQGVGVQAVVTEFLICYTDLIFCDHLPTLAQSNLDVESSMSPKRLRPKSLAISTPTKLITLEEARTKHLLNKTDECGYIEVGGGPTNLPKKYHTIIELPSGSRKRGLSKRSPLGWRSFFSRTRNNSQGSLTKPRKASTPGNIITVNMREKAVTESDLTEMKRKLRPVKSAESLTSGHSEPASTEDILAPLQQMNKAPGHNRSVSHDSYFDTLQNSQNNSDGSLLDLSEIQLNFELEESEMRIFSEDESLVSSPRNQKDMVLRRYLSRHRNDENSLSSNNPSPKKQPRVILSPDSISRKRTRLEDQLSDIQYIDCNTPENTYIFSTTALVHPQPGETPKLSNLFDLYQPKNKSPRNSSEFELKHQSLDLDKTIQSTISKSLTESNIEKHLKFLSANLSNESSTFPSPNYVRLDDSSANESPSKTPADIPYQNLFESAHKTDEDKPLYENVDQRESPVYENILTTISITYKSPVKTPKCPNITKDYENVETLNPEKAVVPTIAASLPLQQATQPSFVSNNTLSVVNAEKYRPKSAGATDSTSAINSPSILVDAEGKPWKSDPSIDRDDRSKSFTEEITVKGDKPLTDNSMDNVSTFVVSPTQSSLSEVIQTSTELFNTSHSSLNFPESPSRYSPLVSPMFTDASFRDREAKTQNMSSQESLNIDRSEGNFQKLTDSTISPFEDRMFGDGKSGDDEKTSGNCLSLKEEMQNLKEEFSLDLCSSDSNNRTTSINLIDFSPGTPQEISQNSPDTDKRKSEEQIDDENSIYQQVKYFRRSVHEVNALLDNSQETSDDSKLDVNLQPTSEGFSLETEVVDLIKSPDTFQEVDEIIDAVKPENKSNEQSSLDSLEADLVNIEEVPSELPESALKESKENNSVHIGVNVKSLTDIFEAKETDMVEHKPPILGGSKATKSSPKPTKAQLDSMFGSSSSSLSEERRVYYDRGGLPPCLRAKNLRSTTKTRSLDEEEFKREFEDQSLTRRKSLDESLANKTKKTLNPPKPVPLEIDIDIHCFHGSIPQFDQKLNRERIEKYKEERRKFLHEKYRSESFKENNKDVLLSRFKQKGSKSKEPEEEKNNKIEDNKQVVLEVIQDQETEENYPEAKVEESNSTSVNSDLVQSIKSKAALFESHITNKSQDPSKKCQNDRTNVRKISEEKPGSRNAFGGTGFRKKEKTEDEFKTNVEFRSPMNIRKSFDTKTPVIRENDVSQDILRQKLKEDNTNKNERRRHTYESREKETESERTRRISLENKSPSGMKYDENTQLFFGRK